MLSGELADSGAVPGLLLILRDRKPGLVGLGVGAGDGNLISSGVKLLFPRGDVGAGASRLPNVVIGSTLRIAFSEDEEKEGEETKGEDGAGDGGTCGSGPEGGGLGGGRSYFAKMFGRAGDEGKVGDGERRRVGDGGATTIRTTISVRNGINLNVPTYP